MERGSGSVSLFPRCSLMHLKEARLDFFQPSVFSISQLLGLLPTLTWLQLRRPCLCCLQRLKLQLVEWTQLGLAGLVATPLTPPPPLQPANLAPLTSTEGPACCEPAHPAHPHPAATEHLHLRLRLCFPNSRLPYSLPSPPACFLFAVATLQRLSTVNI